MYAVKNIMNMISRPKPYIIEDSLLDAPTPIYAYQLLKKLILSV